MKDRDDLGVPEQPASEPPPIPEPLEEKSGTASSVWPWIAGALLVLLVFGGLAAWSRLDRGSGPSEDPVLPDDFVGGPNRAELFGNGRYVAIQTYDAEGAPAVSVWDSQDLDEVSVSGYVLAAAEPAAPTLWLVPTTAQEWEDLYLGSGSQAFERPYDAAPQELLVWDVESGEDPTTAAPARWAKVEGGGEYDAYYEIDPLKGTQPSRLLFNNKASQGEGHKARIPEDVVTFEPRGWSPSGTYVAIEQMIQPEEGTGASAKWSPDASQERRVLIIESSTGDVVSDAAMGPSASTSAFWAVSDDVVLWAEGSNVEARSTGFGLVALEPGLDVATDAAGLGFTPTAEWADAWTVSYAGTGQDAALLLIDTEKGYRISAVTDDGVVDSGAVDFYQDAAFGDRTGLAALETEYDDETGQEWLVLVTYDEHGGGRRIVWRAANALACGG